MKKYLTILFASMFAGFIIGCASIITNNFNIDIDKCASISVAYIIPAFLSLILSKLLTMK